MTIFKAMETKFQAISTVLYQLQNFIQNIHQSWHLLNTFHNNCWNFINSINDNNNNNYQKNFQYLNTEYNNIKHNNTISLDKSFHDLLDKIINNFNNDNFLQGNNKDKESIIHHGLILLDELKQLIIKEKTEKSSYHGERINLIGTMIENIIQQKEEIFINAINFKFQEIQYNKEQNKKILHLYQCYINKQILVNEKLINEKKSNNVFNKNYKK